MADRESYFGFSGLIYGMLIYGVLIGTALVVAPGMVMSYDVTPKVALVLLGGAAAGLLGASWLEGLGRLFADRAGKLLAVAIGMQAISAVVSTLGSLDPALSWVGAEWRRLGLATELALALWTLALACWAAASPARIETALRAMAIAGLVGGLYGTAQYFGFDPLQDPALYHVGEGRWTIVRPPGTLGHAAYFATFLLHGAFAGIALATTETGRGWRLLGRTTAGVAAVAVVLSGTRSAIVGLVAGALFLWMWFRPALRPRTWVLAAALASMSVLFYYSPLGERLSARTRWYVEDASGGGRLHLWRDAWSLGQDNWIAGTGPETFSAAFLPYQSIELTRVAPERYHESPHNILLDAWTAQGAPGLLALAVLIGAAGLGLWDARESGSRKLAGLLAAGFVAALCSNQFIAFVAATKLYFLSQAALLAASGAVDRRPVAVSSGLRAALRFSALAACPALIFFSFQLVRADWVLQRVRNRIVDGEPRQALTKYEQYLAVKPSGLYADLWFSREMMSAAASAPPEQAQELWANGRKAALRATERSETPQNAWYNLATLQAEEGDVEGTQESLRAAAEIAPQWYKPRWMLAQVLLTTGDLNEAKPLVRRAYELTGGGNEEVRTAWERLENTR